MFPQSITVQNAPHDTTTAVTSFRNQNRNHRPCGSCSARKVRCIVSDPYTKLLCKRCKEEGWTECKDSYVQKNHGKRRAPYQKRKRDTAPPTERSDASNLVFTHENMSTANNAELSQVGSVEIDNIAQNHANVSSQTAIATSAENIQYSVAHGYGEAIPDRQQANDIGSSSGSTASTSAVPANSFEGPNANAECQA